MVYHPINNFMGLYFRYMDMIPKLSDNLLSEIQESIEENKNWFFKEDYEYYQRHEATLKLREWSAIIFHRIKNRKTCVQVVHEGIHIHKDIARVSTYNYLIDAGGNNVETCFYDDNFSLIKSIKIEPFRWHKLDVSVNHNVINIQRPRIALTVFDCIV